jgi:hypothetical protein
MNKKRQMSYDRFNVVLTNNTSPYAIKNTHYVFRPADKTADDTDMDLTQARAVIDFIKGL